MGGVHSAKLARTTEAVQQICSDIVKSACQKNNFLISQPKHMLWVLKRIVSMRRFF